MLDLVAKVLSNPVDVAALPRMGDAGQTMAAVDAAIGSESLKAYMRAQDSIAETVLEGDPVATVVIGLLNEQSDGEWTGTATELYGVLSGRTAERKQWPGNPRALSSRLKRLKPAFRDAYDIEVAFSRGKGPPGEAPVSGVERLRRPAGG